VARNRGAAVAAPTGGDSVTTQRMRIPTNGPHDGDTLAPEITPAPGTVDFGAVRVPVPAGGMVSVEPTTAGRIQAVHVTVPEGRLSVSALAAPRNEGLWAELAVEIDASLREGGARVRSFTGEWGRELHATTDGATSVFVGVDGPRWMLYGVATGPTRDAVSLDARLRRMLRGTVVVRGKAPYPVRTVLPLVTPSGAGIEEQAATSAPPTMTLRAPAAAAVGEVLDGSASASSGIRDASGPTNGAMTFSGPFAASTNGAVNGAVNGAAAAGPVSGAAAGSPPNGATTGVFRRNGASRPGASTTGATRKDVPLPGASTAGASRTGATPAGVPVGSATPPPRSGFTRRRQAAAAAGVPFPGAPTNGAPGAPTNGAARPGIGTPGANRRGHGASTGANHTGANQIGIPTGYNHAGAAATGTNRIGAPTGANYTGPAVPGAGRPGATNGANSTGGNTGSTPTGTTWSGAYPSGAPSAADAGTSPYGMPADDAPLHHPAPGAPMRSGQAAGGVPGVPPAPTWDGGRPAPPPWPPTPSPLPSGATGALPTDGPLGGPTTSGPTGSYPTPAPADAAPRPGTNGAPLGPAGFPTAAAAGGSSRPDVPAAWAHETGMDRRPAVGPVVDGGFATPPPAPIAHHETALPPGSPVTGSYAPRAEIPRFTSGPVADRPSWADTAPSDRDAADHWDPLVDPLPIDLEPLPVPDPVWNDGRDGATNGRLDTAFDDRTAASHGPGGRQDAGELTNGATARRWRAADLLRDRDGDDAVGDGTARRWRAADLLAGRDDTRGATDVASPKWRAADLLDGRGGNAVPRSQETGSAASLSRYENTNDVDAGASGRGNGREDIDEAGYGMRATRWRAADLLDGSEPAVGDRTRRRRTTEPSESQQVTGHAESRRRAAAPDDGHGDDATRWRAADLLDGGLDADRAPSPAAQQAAFRPGRGHADSSDTSTAPTWRAAELLDGRGSSDAATAEPRRRVADLRDSHGDSGRAVAAEPRRRVADRLEGRSGDAEAGGESRWRAASLLAGRGESGGAETATADPWDTSSAHDRRADGDFIGDDPPARRWRAADLLDGGNAETTRPRRRARTPDLAPATGGASAPLPDAPTGRRRRGASTDDTPTGQRHAPTPPDARHDRSGGDTPSRHGGENRHAGTPSRVPPTQWAWPKEPTPPSSEPLPARRAADAPSRAAWSASDLLDEGKHAGGRRRAPESARHGKPTDDEAGRHYRP
jgi:hypothetical protein